MKAYYINDNGVQKGPFNLEELKELKIQKETQVWFDGIENWTSAGHIDELKELIVKLPPPINKPSDFVENNNSKINNPSSKPRSKYKWIIILLIIFIALFIGYIEIQKRQLESRLKQQELLETQRRNEELERQRQERLLELSNTYDNTLNKLRFERERLSEIKRFKFLRTASEKEQEIENQLKVIRKLEVRLERIQDEINSL